MSVERKYSPPLRVIAKRGKRGDFRWQIVDIDNKVWALAIASDSYETAAQALKAGRLVAKAIAESTSVPSGESRWSKLWDW